MLIHPPELSSVITCCGEFLSFHFKYLTISQEEEREVKIFVEILAMLAAGSVGLSGEDPTLPGPDFNILTTTGWIHGLDHPSEKDSSSEDGESLSLWWTSGRSTFGLRWNITNVGWLAMNFGETFVSRTGLIKFTFRIISWSTFHFVWCVIFLSNTC